MHQPLHIAVIGSGISGMTAAALLHSRHAVTLFEANDYIGGHTHTVNVAVGGEPYAIDTGFIVFNDGTYPNFCRLLEQLGVASQPTDMSFAVRCDRSGLEYNGSSLNGLFAQRRNLMRPRFHRMLRDILRFNREAVELLDSLPEDMTVAEFVNQRRYSRWFADQYLLPMGAAIWSCPTETFGCFPIRFIIEFYAHHGLLQIHDRPQWRVISGGSQRYVEKLTAPWRDRIRLSTPVEAVRRVEGGVRIASARGAELFDEVIFACHSDTALRILQDADAMEESLLRAFPYSRNRVVLHTDPSVLPRRRRAWASWNYHIPRRPAARPTVSYWMNRLQGIESPHDFCVTLNEEDSVDPANVLGTYNYSHPVFTGARAAAQRRHADVIRRRGVSFCGAYWGNGFHEDGVRSALAVCTRFGVDPHKWSVAREQRAVQVHSPREPLHREVTHAG